MKRTIITMMAVVAALWANANERFYIEDFSISVGETKQVSIILENVAQYTAFQTDIYLPEGLTVEKEDDEYAFELTSRKSRDHVIFGQDRSDGAIRLMSYSMQVKPFIGNSGALATFNITASANFSGGTIELKHTLFTDMNDQEISFVNESCQVQLQLKELTGEICFEYGGEKTTVYVVEESSEGPFVDLYDYLYISYSGEELVGFRIYVNDLDLLNDERYNSFISWDNTNKRYIIELRGLAEQFAFDEYFSLGRGYLFFDVTVFSDGYDLISSSFQDFEYLGTGGPWISEFGISDLTYYIMISYWSSIHGSYCPGGHSFIDEGAIEGGLIMYNLFAVERLDHDYYLTVGAAERSPDYLPPPGYGVWFSTAETFLIPARTCSLSISQYDSIKPEQDYYIVDYASLFHAGEKELGNDFAIIESSGWRVDYVYNDFNSDLIYNDINLIISIDHQQISNGINRLENRSIAINLLPLGDIYGGEHHVEVTANDSVKVGGAYPFDSYRYCNSLSVDTVVEYHPITTRLTLDSFILDVDSGMCNAMLRINGLEVDLSTDGDALYYAFDRRINDYSVTVQVGDKVTNDDGEVYSAWSQETTIVVPAKSNPGDVNGDGIVNVNDVTILIKKILGTEIEPFINGNADITGEGTLNVADVTALIQMILNN